MACSVVLPFSSLAAVAILLSCAQSLPTLVTSWVTNRWGLVSTAACTL